MRVFLTGGTGFIGSHVAKLLRDRGDEVVALVRSPGRATALVGLGCEIIQGDLNDRVGIDRGLQGADAVLHIAARYEIGLRTQECPKMEDVNVGGVRRILDSAIEAATPRVVYLSTINALGNTNEVIADETFQRDESKGFLSCYDSSKYKAHRLTESRIGHGAPIVIAQPGVVYGPGDHSEVGREILMAATGRLSFPMMTRVGLSMAHVEDVADGIVRILDNGTIGESYLLGGENVRLRTVLEQSAQLAGRKISKRDVPVGLLRAISPLGPFLAPKLGYPPNLKELIRVSDGVTYWAKSDKAQSQLGYSYRPLKEGLADTLRAAGVPLSS